MIALETEFEFEFAFDRFTSIYRAVVANTSAFFTYRGGVNLCCGKRVVFTRDEND